MTPPDDKDDYKGANPQRPWPQLGDLAIDAAKNNTIGIVVGLPGEPGSDWLTYHLQAPGGGPEWSATADASTLRPISSQISHTTTKARLEYDHDADHWALEIQLHYDNGSVHNGFLIIAADQVEELLTQFKTGERMR